jgi:tetratricopeptide (TPR) repeat protein
LETSSYTLAAPGDGTPRTPPLAVAEAVLLALLGASRDGTLAAWMQRHRHVVRWLGQRLLPVVNGAAGDALRDDGSRALAVQWLLRWAIAGLRPDQAPVGAPIGREDWLSRPSWRPMLAVACHFGFEAVPAFRDRYHAQPDEAPSSQLCGLWSVGPSTYYRYLDKARGTLAATLRAGVLDAAQSLSLRAAVGAMACERLGLHDEGARRTWHAAQSAAQLAAGDAAGALWHAAQAGDVSAFVSLLKARQAELAVAAETDPLIEQQMAAEPAPAQRFELLLVQAALWRLRGAAEREQVSYEQALSIAAAADDALLLGRVYGALGKFHEPRDADRAFAYYQDCTDCLWRAGVGEAGVAAPDLVEQYVVALVRLAWLHVRHNDPRSKAALDRADALRARHRLAAPVQAMIEQAWGEYWRRAQDLKRALEHKHRALNLYERVADQESVFKTCCNLALIYGEARDVPRAIEYSQRVLAMAGSVAVEPEVVASTHLNLGAAHFWQGDSVQARQQYELALDLALRGNLRFVAGRAHYNLAEVAYLAFKQGGDPADEAAGDRHTAAALSVWPHESDPAYADATRKLKGEILGDNDIRCADRLAPQESVLHPAEHAQVQVQREVLAVPSAPEVHVRAHLRIAQAYLAVAMKEREAALALMHRHGLAHRFDTELALLRATFERELTREQQLARQWAAQAADLLPAARCQAVLARLLDAGAVNKSAYADLCGVSPATASKHLAALAERGLVVQSGKGPSTRYLLPAPG